MVYCLKSDHKIIFYARIVNHLFFVFLWACMTVMQRLESFLGEMPAQQNDNGVWIFGDELSKKDPVFFEAVLRNHLVLMIEYSVLCTHLTADFFRKDRLEKELTENLRTALVMAELLAYIHKHHLIVSRDVIRLEAEQKIYRNLLHLRGYQFRRFTPFRSTPDTLTQTIRAATASYNWPRLFFIRSKRFFGALVPLLKQLEDYARFIVIIDTVSNPILSYLSWLFFIPRLITNLFLLMKHLIPGPWMEENEKNLHFFVRLNAQLQRRWFEIGNDSVWMVAGILNCFLWLGPLAAVGIYVNVALYVYDIVLAGLRAYLEISRLKNIQNGYREQAKNLTSPTERDENSRFQQHLDDRVWFEQKRLMVSVINTSLLTLAIIICLPTFAINPVIPLLGAFFLLAITIAAYAAGKYVESQRPPNQISKLTRHSLFAPPKPAKPIVNLDERPSDEMCWSPI